MAQDMALMSVTSRLECPACNAAPCLRYMAAGLQAVCFATGLQTNHVACSFILLVLACLAFGQAAMHRLVKTVRGAGLLVGTCSSYSRLSVLLGVPATIPPHSS